MPLGKVISTILIAAICNCTYAQTKTIQIKKGESWYGGAVTEGQQMPLKEGYSSISLPIQVATRPLPSYYLPVAGISGVMNLSNFPFTGMHWKFQMPLRLLT